MTTSSAIVAVMILVVFTAALLTAREDVPETSEVTRQELPPAPIAVEQKSPRNTPLPLVATTTAVTRTAESPMPQPPAASMNTAIAPERERTASATISGCLESDEGTFRLTDASGANAPTARNWKSGFLKKRPAHIELADGVGTLNLRSHVGRRVAATGTLADRVMRVDSVRVVGACG
jgi:hypothetical protein